jgi:cytochrome c oxidase subunit 2
MSSRTCARRITDQRADKIFIAATLLVCGVLSATSLRASGGQSEERIKISARRFAYDPNQIVLKRGVPVVIELKSEDRLHGFNIPSMNLRANIEPGKITELKVTPQKTGDFDFFCDIFCGSGHEGMNGKITVKE